MFSPETYINRRHQLKERMPSGVVLFLGHEHSPINFPDVAYPFRQDSSFLYFWGLNFPGLAGLMDLDSGQETIFGSELTTEDMLWNGIQPTLAESCRRCGVDRFMALERLGEVLRQAMTQGRKIHYLPQYRPANRLKIFELLGIHPNLSAAHVSLPLIQAVVAIRSIKTDQEIQQIEDALDVTFEMQTMAMRLARPGLLEKDVAAQVSAIANTHHGVTFIIFTTNGHIFHNPDQNNQMADGQMVIHDSGADSPLCYATDITRTFPVGGRFSQQQRDIYSLVLDAQQKAIDAAKPGVEFRQVHLLASRVLADGLKSMGLMKGDVDSAVAQGAHALFFPCGLGHMMGLDVHDMEGLGEDHVGYNDTIKRSAQFGTDRLRMAKALEPGHVITVEPGVYFNPNLIAQWQAEAKFSDFIDYTEVRKYSGFTGIRLEDDILVTQDGNRILGKQIPKSIQDVEDLSSQSLT
jgi:Xaa-Pro dipeptidase